MKQRRTVVRLALAAIVGLCMVASFAVGGTSSAGAQGKGENHGATVSAVAKSDCTATVPANPSVSNHGQCVSAAAHKNKSTPGPSTVATSGAVPATTSTSGSGSTHKHHNATKKHTHAKKHLKKHKASKSK